MNKTIIAIDPGASGGIAWEYPDSKACVMPMLSTEGDIIKLLSSAFTASPNCPIAVFMEDLVKHMGAGIPASTMAVYASNWGLIKGAVMMAGHPLHLVTPQRWQKALGLGITGRQKATTIIGISDEQMKDERKRVSKLNSALKKDWKNKLKGEAQRLYPHLDPTLKTADALLILAYAKAQP